MSRTKVQAALESAGDLLPSPPMAAPLCVPSGWGGGREPCGVSHMGTEPIMGAPPSQAHHFLQPRLPIPSCQR